jgi:hypothetical protein
MIGVEAGIQAAGGVEAARHQAGADEEEQRDGDLRHHQAGAHPPASSAARRGILVDDRDEIHSRALHRRDEAKNERAGARGRCGEANHQGVDFDVEEQPLRSSEPLRVADEERQTPVRQQHAERGARHGQDDVLDEEQPDNACPRGAKRQPHRDLAAP